MAADKKTCWFCSKEIQSNPISVTTRKGTVRYFHYECSNIDRTHQKPARVIRLDRYKK